MNGPEHYAEAERLRSIAAKANTSQGHITGAAPAEFTGRMRADVLAEAQVCATLAHAQATQRLSRYVLAAAVTLVILTAVALYALAWTIAALQGRWGW